MRRLILAALLCAGSANAQTFGWRYTGPGSRQIAADSGACGRKSAQIAGAGSGKAFDQEIETCLSGRGWRRVMFVRPPRDCEPVTLALVDSFPASLDRRGSQKFVGRLREAIGRQWIPTADDSAGRVLLLVIADDTSSVYVQPEREISGKYSYSLQRAIPDEMSGPELFVRGSRGAVKKGARLARDAQALEIVLSYDPACVGYREAPPLR